MQTAVTDGRLTLAELDERLGQLYETKYRHELSVLVRDLPAEPEIKPGVASAGARPRASGRLGRFSGPLAVHAVVVGVMSVMLIGRWVASDTPFFWPVFPMFWLWMSVLVHALVRNRAWQRRARPTTPANAGGGSPS
ncbi:hypothetical protein GCM10027569_41210 [Flindersiella endophytica]